MDKLYYGISEVAEMVGETPVTVRFWSNNFSKYLSPKRNSKGNRFYTADQVEIVKKIKYLTRDCGLTLDAVARKLSQKDKGEDKTLIIRDSLLDIRAQLEQILESL